ncbi:MAG: DUF4397 domain-containing protein [Saprospiraceae bacterium]|nr:DUF4397 domain-containing protein [Saprospiraceae bacterium]MBK8450889.1 DUF4397 domain-containing protein [Saprospiraceae bacterium]MBK9223165.1 DUF4397 domain-containing protein [Saprospiraceae bacterium]MBK9720694.1 DUF4397 domain-containing protein [Saprospiraceae bacterium]MBK9727684.1 DUF4397 domain-containing protein [Saprospiraceae bacterium]
MKKYALFLSFGWILFSGILFQNCSKDDAGASGPANLMFVNGLTDGKVSTVIIADSTIVALTAGFGSFSAYNQIQNGSQSFKIRDNTTGSIVVSNNFNISGEKNYTLMATGNTLNPELVIQEDNLTISDSSKGYIRLINLSSNSNQMTLSITSGADLVSGVNYKSSSDFVSLSPNKYDLSIKSGATEFAKVTNFNLNANKKYSILVTGLVGQTPKASVNFIINK